jgi:hypothetical protein
VVAGDLDNDGDVDLIVTTWENWPTSKQAMYVFENRTPDGGNWIGFRFRPSEGKSPIGATVLVETDSGSLVQQLVTGDSYRSQRAGSMHFGLGAGVPVKVEIGWPNGEKRYLERPVMNRYYVVE